MTRSNSAPAPWKLVRNSARTDVLTPDGLVLLGSVECRGTGRKTVWVAFGPDGAPLLTPDGAATHIRQAAAAATVAAGPLAVAAYRRHQDRLVTVVECGPLCWKIRDLLPGERGLLTRREAREWAETRGYVVTG